MEMILATKSSTPIIGQLATVMGWIMDGISENSKEVQGKKQRYCCNAENAGGNTGCISEIRRISYRKLCTACNPVPYFDGLISGNL